ncbi:BQ2448_4608 [Microbotryum intermedium]|uniref:BQ2448_4608 protein n=1 Tax=Microbotryum intermedium TaxID=269621 RepID=A0A238FJ51_9BASI|nr:BQ2448_4608 [Microbotryum intermedium]
MSNCLACTDPIPKCQCPAGVACFQSQRNCTTCPRNICASSSPSSSSSGQTLGSTIGGAVGGVAGIIVALGFLYFLWWKPRGLEASRRRYSKHITNRQSKMPPPPATTERRASNADAVGKRTSIHLRMDGTPEILEAGARRRSSPNNTIPFGGRHVGDSTRALGGHSSASLESENPFADHDRSSIGSFEDDHDAMSTRTSDFSFRSSQSTNIIPIAYIPPHSNSMAIDDANRGAFGEILSDDTRRESLRPAPIRTSMPVSMASHDSLSFVNSDLIDLHPLPPMLSAEKLSASNTTAPSGAPLRPPRSPGLDLKLPSIALPSAPTLTSPHANTLGMRPTSSLLSPPGASSRSSSNGGFTSSSPTSSRGMSVLLERSPAGILSMPAGSHLSTISSMSTSTTQTRSSTMSYILDPPQIITPVNAQGVRRVEVLGRGQAGLVKLQGSAASATSPTPSSSFGSPGPTPTPKITGTMQVQRAAALATVSNEQNPFSDASQAEGTRRRSSRDSLLDPREATDRRDSLSTITDGPDESGDVGSSSPRWTASSVQLGGAGDRATAHSIQFDAEPPSPGFNRSPQPPLSIASSTGLGIPSSARSSAYSDIDGETGSRSRPLTGDSQWISTASASGRPDSSTSIAGLFVSNSSLRSSVSPSMRDGVTLAPTASLSSPSFLSDGASSAQGTRISQTPSFPMPPQRPMSTLQEGLNPSQVTTGADASFSAPVAVIDVTSPSSDGSANRSPDPDSPLPTPFLPFAGQRPTSSASLSATSDVGGRSKQRVESQAISVRSGFASGLSQIPFTLDGGLRDSMLLSDRGSVISLSVESAQGDDDDEVRPDERTTVNRTSKMSYLSATNDEGDVFADGAGRPISFASSMGDSSYNGDDSTAEDIVVMQAEVLPLHRSTSMRKTFSNATTGTSRSEALANDSSNPFDEHAEILMTAGADPGASVDSLAISAALSRSFEDLQDAS